MAASDPAVPILRLEPDDAHGLWPLSIEAGWNQIVADWRLMLAAGRGFGIRDEGGQDGGGWIASAVALPLGAAIWWISMVLVTRRRRREGHGGRLLSRCMAEIDRCGGAMGLDATEFGRPIYRSLGFRDLYALSRWHIERAASTALAPPPGLGLRAATARDLARIADYDAANSGFARATVLGNLLSRAPSLAHVAERGDGGLAGFVLGRDGHRATHVGPIIADDQAIGAALLSRALSRAAVGVIVDVPDHQDRIGSWLRSEGASALRRYMRMLHGTAPAIEDGKHVFACAGPELA
jgi:GNAT superfamily N-acetyltransferase